MRKYRKPYRVRKKKSILHNRFFKLSILFSIFLISLTYFLFFSEIFRIKKITISGGNITLSLPTENIFLLNTSKLKEDILNQFPKIAEVKIKKNFPNALNIQISERQAVAVWCKNQCFLIDKDGVPFAEAPAQANLIKVSADKSLLPKVSQILEIQSKLKKNLGIDIKEADLVSPQRLNVKTFEDWEIYFNLEGDLDWQIQELGLVLEKEISSEKRKSLQYIDLRFTRVYYK